MQNNVAADYQQLVEAVNAGRVKVEGYRFIVVQIGLDWCLSMKKSSLREC